MVDNITQRADGSFEMAFAGNGKQNEQQARNDIWHRHGNFVDLASKPLDHWLDTARMNWDASKRAAYILVDGKFVPVDGQYFIARNDNNYVLSPSVTEQYKVHNVSELAHTFEDYISNDNRFQFSAMGSVRGGARIWFCAQFNGEYKVANEAHKAYLLATTAFDTTQATQANMSDQRSICENTIRIALGRTDTMVRTTHRSVYDKKRVCQELAALAQQVDQYKAIGDAMAQIVLPSSDVSDFFKSLLDIPFDAKREDISTRKFNQFDALRVAYKTTVEEGTEGNKVWTALQSVTRYVDHDRAVRAGDNGESHARFVASQFGTGADLKLKAWNLLLPLVKDKVAA
jgi:phage/plasmid-like protein (TIGR03299 family)